MGKNDIAGFSLWESYSSEVRKRMNNPSHLGSFTDEDATKRGLKLVSVMHGAETCGDAVELFLLVNDNGVVRDARFLSFGCGTAIASSDMMCELCLGKTIDEISKITNIDVEKALRDSPDKPAVPGQKMHCSVMAYDVLKKAVADYKGVDYQELIDNEIVCECAQVTKQTVVDAIRNNDLKTVEEITSYTKAGGYCKSCIRPGGHEKRSVYLIDILNQTRADMEREKKSSEPEKTFSELTLPRKLRYLEDILDEYVRPVLKADAGDLEIADMDGNKVHIEYQGSCATCAAGKVGTKDFIEKTLKEKADPEIEVVVD